MKTKMKRQGSTELPRFAVGALAIAGASAANAATVQITFTGSYISTSGGNHLVTDFGGDGDNEIAGFANQFSAGIRVGTSTFAYAFDGVGGSNGVVIAGVASAFGFGDRSVRGVSKVVVSFSDSSIRGGATTIGYLDLGATVVGSNKSVTVNRLIFDKDTGGTIAGLNVNNAAFTEFSAVPEPSSLGLLALGAGGLLARRRAA
jgi:hypothetical protein